MSPGVQQAPQKWSVFAAVGSSYFIIVVATTLSVLALPAIAEDFDITLRAAGWVVIAESLIIAALLLPLGRLSDIVGRHRTMRIGVVVFGVGLVLTGLSPTFGFLIGARIVTALGNTLIQAVGTGILVAAFPSEERGLALGGQTSAVAVGAAIGPLLGGFLLDEMSWKTLFLGLAIPTALILVVVHFGLSSKDRGDPKDAAGQGLDVAGGALAASFIVVLVLAVTDPFGFGFTSPIIIGGALGAIGLLAVFIRTELSQRAPMLDLRLFQIDDFRSAVILRFLGFLSSSTLVFLLPIYLLGVRELSTLTAGSLIALIAVGMTVGAQISGRLYDQLGPRRPVVAGFIVQAGVFVLLATFTEGTSLVLVALASVSNGLALGLWNVPTNSMMMGAIPAESFGVGGAFTNVNRTIGSVFAQAVATALVAGVMAAQGFDIPLGDIAETDGASSAFIDGWMWNFVAGLVITLAALVVSLRISNISEDDHVDTRPAPSTSGS